MIGEIVKSDVWMLAIDLPKPFPLSFGALYNLPRVFLVLTIENDGEPIISIGEASIDFPFSHYDAWDVFYSLKEISLEGVNVADRESVLRSSNTRKLLEFPAAFAALNMAFDDAYGKFFRKSIPSLYGYVRTKGKVLESISIDPDQERFDTSIKEISLKGRFPKIKGGLGVEEDLNRIRYTLRSIKSKTLALAIDFNGYYKVDQFKELCSSLVSVTGVVDNVMFLEQPTQFEDGIEGLIEIKNTLQNLGLKIPVMADESFINIDDAIKCKSGGILLNYKIQKIGGILRALEIEKSLGKPIGLSMVGGTFPTAIGRVWDQQACCVLKSAKLPSDAWEPATDWFKDTKHFIMENFDEDKGFSRAKFGIGLGITVDWNKLKKYKIENPKEEYLRIRQNMPGKSIVINLRGKDTYSELYQRLVGKSADWNL